jgi:hypothetical protein
MTMLNVRLPQSDVDAPGHGLGLQAMTKLLEGALMAAGPAPMGTQLAALVAVLQEADDPETTALLDAAAEDFDSPAFEDVKSLSEKSSLDRSRPSIW